jgi:uncharacterized protein GlcG (DUF336 family)
MRGETKRWFRASGLAFGVVLGGVLATATPLFAQDCGALPTHDQLRDALKSVVAVGDPSVNGGLAFHMWATTVNRDGVVCAVAFSGDDRGAQWPGSRVISAQKANTANAFSLPGFALSTANLFSAVQPGQSLFGLQESNPVNPSAAYGGDATKYGEADDPLVGQKVGGVNVFGGGLALYNGEGTLVGAVGVSGDTSCTDHIVAWKLRDALGLDKVPAGVNSGTDNIIFDTHVDAATGHTTSPSGFGHPTCDAKALGIGNFLPATHPVTK